MDEREVEAQRIHDDQMAIRRRLTRLQEAVWPGLPKWEPTPEEPQQDFYEAIIEAFRDNSSHFHVLMEHGQTEATDCLIESHKLLRHYAGLLNQYDGGKRVIPESVLEWIQRCKETSGEHLRPNGT